mgnify:CR=1 FL=1
MFPIRNKMIFNLLASGIWNQTESVDRPYRSKPGALFRELRRRGKEGYGRIRVETKSNA